MLCIGGGWVGGSGAGWAVGVGGKALGRFSLPLGHQQWYCPSESDRYVHNPQDGSRRTLSVV